MNILIAADSFKGSCSARQVTDTIERAAKNVIPDVTITKIPVADGGEGTVDALVAAMRGTKVSVPAHDPLGAPNNRRVWTSPGRQRRDRDRRGVRTYLIKT